MQEEPVDADPDDLSLGLTWLLAVPSAPAGRQVLERVIHVHREQSLRLGARPVLQQAPRSSGRPSPWRRREESMAGGGCSGDGTGRAATFQG